LHHQNFVRLVTPLLLALLPPVPATAELASPSQVVESLHEVLIDTMKNAESLEFSGRFKKLAPVIGASFDQSFMARKSVGRSWKTFNEADQARWRDTFARMTVANYAGRFRGYSGESFETLGQDAAPHETVMVRTMLHLPSDSDVELAYRLHRTDSGWKIIDIYMNGTISELALRRSDYSATLKRKGLDSLVANLERMMDEFEERGGQPLASIAR
jgi:phospholipid transport system substrate-binding protein